MTTALGLFFMCFTAEALGQGLPAAFPKDFFSNHVHAADYYTFANSGTFGQFAELSPGDKHITWTRRERADDQVPWNYVRARFTTSFFITAVTANDAGDTAFIAGVAEDGTRIVERWTLPPRRGTWLLRSATTAQPIGVSMPPFTASVSVRGGGSYVPPTDDAELAPARTVIYRGFGMPAPVAMDSDVEGRQLLMLTKTGHLWQMDVTSQTPASPQILLGPETVPELASASSLTFLNHPTDPARYFRLDCDPQSPDDEYVYVVWKDVDNDAQFDSLETLSASAYAAAYGTVAWQPWYE